MAALLHIHGSRNDTSIAVLEELRTGGVDVRSIPATAAPAEPFDVAVITPDVESPLQVARSIHRGAPEAHIVFLATPEQEPALRRDLLIGRIGSRWSIGPAETPSAAVDVIRQAIHGTERRRQLRTTIGSINTRLANVTLPPRRAMISDHFLASVLDQLSDAVVVLDPEGMVLAFNEAASGAYGRIARGASFLETLPAAAGEAVRDAVRNPEGEAETVLTAGDGTEYSLRATSLRDRTGVRIGMALVARDISGMKSIERRRDLIASSVRILSSTLEARTALQRLVELLTIEFADMSVADVQDEQSIHRYAIAVRTREQRAAMEGMGNFEIGDNPLHPSTLAMTRRESIVRADLDDDELRAITMSEESFRAVRALGRQSLIATPLLAGDTTVGAILVLRSGEPFSNEDVETMAEIARQASTALQNIGAFHSSEEAGRMKDEFLATLSHELRTPITSILGWAQMLQLEPSDPEMITQGLAAIERGARAQAQLIDDLLDISRMQMGQLRLHVRTFALAEIARTAVETVRPAAHARGITIRVDMSDSGVIAGDPHRIQQVLWNLLSNAMKFSETGGEVHVSVKVEDSQVVVRVADGGKGIDTAFLPYVFDRFRQGEAAVTRRFGGLGLGLSIVKQIVELHGGSVQAESPGPGKGATFTIRFPLPAVAPAGEETMARRSPEAVTPLAGLSVLLFDEDHPSTSVLSAILEKAGAAVRHASNIQQFAAMIEEHPPDVIVDGRTVADDVGLAFIRHLRSTFDHLPSQLPAVALTAHHEPSAHEVIRQAGFQSVLVKPVGPETLTSTLAAVVRRSRETGRA